MSELLTVHSARPPPQLAKLLRTRQLFRVQANAPPPYAAGELFESTQEFKFALAAPPPPFACRPLRRVKPVTETRFDRYRQRIWLPPSITVSAAPLTLCSVSGLRMATRLV